LKKIKHQTKNTENKNNINRNKKIKSVLLGIGIATVSYVIFGIVTSIISNIFFTRMTPFGLWERISLIVTSVLLGAYVGLAYYAKSSEKDNVCNTTATAGGVFGFLTFGCSICNRILVFFLGVSGVFTYFEPIRPFLGIVSILFLGFAIYTKAGSMAAV